MRKIGLIGAGAMGSAILNGLISKQIIQKDNIIVVEKDVHKRQAIAEDLTVKTTADLNQLDVCDLVIVAVKPYSVEKIVSKLRNSSITCLISVAAGISLANLIEWSGKPAVRVMPNTPCLIGKGVSAIAYSGQVPELVKTQVQQIFSGLGTTVVLDESLFDAVTAVSGCGPAYVYLIIEAMIDAACAQGLTRDVGRELVVSTFLGATEMVNQFPIHPAELRDKVTSPGGVTIQAIHILEQYGLRGILWNAVETAANRSQEMTKN